LSILLKWFSRFRWLTGNALTIMKAVWDKRSPWQAKAAMIAMLVYAISPLDLIPEFLMLFGIIDDLFLLTLGFNWLAKRLPEEVRRDYGLMTDQASV
jgi:uncharacterized membrane protein YkvA (DUF1232 family)